MPDFDGGHYFLTTLIPIRGGAVATAGAGGFSHLQSLRAELERLPTASQSEASAASDLQSPFGRNLRTHFARFVVIEDLVFNGREGDDPLAMKMRAESPLVPRPVDELNCAYLMFTADFDAKSGSVQELRSYAEDLWTTMRAELEAVLQHCIGFDKIDSAEAFAAYLEACQVETTMPFNDYFLDPIDLEGLKKANLAGWPERVMALVAGSAGPAKLAAFAIGAAHLGVLLAPLFGWLPATSILVLLAADLCAVALLLLLLRGVAGPILRKVEEIGARPLPTAPGSDLPTVLKAIYLQQHFAQFAAIAQGLDEETLSRRFGEFLADHAPDVPDDPTQPPGVVHSQPRSLPEPGTALHGEKR